MAGRDRLGLNSDPSVTRDALRPVSRQVHRDHRRDRQSNLGGESRSSCAEHQTRLRDIEGGIGLDGHREELASVVSLAHEIECPSVQDHRGFSPPSVVTGGGESKSIGQVNTVVQLTF